MSTTRDLSLDAIVQPATADARLLALRLKELRIQERTLEPESRPVAFKGDSSANARIGGWAIATALEVAVNYVRLGQVEDAQRVLNGLTSAEAPVNPVPGREAQLRYGQRLSYQLNRLRERGQDASRAAERLTHEQAGRRAFVDAIAQALCRSGQFLAASNLLAKVTPEPAASVNLTIDQQRVEGLAECARVAGDHARACFEEALPHGAMPECVPPELLDLADSQWAYDSAGPALIHQGAGRGLI